VLNPEAYEASPYGVDVQLIKRSALKLYLRAPNKKRIHEQMNTYETVFILNPVLSAEQVGETVKKFKGIIGAQGGKVSHTEDWGLKKLAYPIEKKKSGFYQMLEFDMPGEGIRNLEIEMKRDERVMRFLSVALDKYAKEYAEKRKGKLKSKS
jgi:small subunit ribosomal protein S6